MRIWQGSRTAATWLGNQVEQVYADIVQGIDGAALRLGAGLLIVGWCAILVTLGAFR